MKIRKQNRIILITQLVLAAFALVAALLPGFPFKNASSVLTAVMCIVFMMSVGRRIVNAPIRRLLVSVGMLLFVLFILQIVKYSYSIGLPVHGRYIQYLYHVPMTGVALLSFYAALYIGKSRDKGVIKRWGWLVLVWVALCALMLTNDFHRLAYKHIADGDATGYNIVYYLAVIWQAALSVATLFISLFRSRVLNIRRLGWAPFSVLFIGLLIFVAYALNGGKIYIGEHFAPNFQEVYAYVAIAFWEACIQIGLVPSNGAYNSVFENSSIKAIITDSSGNIFYTSEKSFYLTPEQAEQAKHGTVMLSADKRVRVNAINGGYVYYEDDITNINALNERLADAAELIAEENIITENENRIKQETAQLEAQNLLYDTLSYDLTPILTRIESLISNGDYRMACVLGAYVKRRANLFILSHQQEKQSIKELVFAINESLSYLKLMGVEGYCFVDDEEDISAFSMLSAYDYFETVVENALDTLGELMVVVNSREIRINLDSQSVSYSLSGGGEAGA